VILKNPLLRTFTIVGFGTLKPVEEWGRKSITRWEKEKRSLAMKLELSTMFAKGHFSGPS